MTEWYREPVWMNGPLLPIVPHIRQSNAGGQPALPSVLEPSVPRQDIPTFHCHQSYPTNFEKIAIEPLHYHALDPDDLYGRQSTGGEVEFGVRMADVYGRTCGIVTAWAGATGYLQWTPMLPTGLTSRAIGFVDLFIEKLAVEWGVRGYVCGPWYTGGEQEATDAAISVIYKQVLDEEYFRWSSRYGAGLPFVIDRLKVGIDRLPANIDAVRAGEQAFADATPTARLVDTSSFPMMADNLHYPPDSLAGKAPLAADAFASMPLYAPTPQTHVTGEIFPSYALAAEVADRFGTAVRKDLVDARWAAETPIGRHFISRTGWAVV